MCVEDSENERRKQSEKQWVSSRCWLELEERVDGRELVQMPGGNRQCPQKGHT